jgi:hypothetical protein
MNLYNKNFIFILLMQVISCTTPELRQEAEDTILPTTWTKDFSISLYTGGGMLNESLTIDFNYDSCKYVEKKGDEKNIVAFQLNENQKNELLEKMKSFHADEIHSRKTEGITYDKESNDICFHNKTEFCISDGAASDIEEKDIANYSGIYQYLLNFAKQKGEIK